ncbi:cytochrome P450 [Ramaria rubella]|nr:cytochrome P450 [Ramaria rubella]
MPNHHEWETHTRWAKEYGGLVYLEVFKQPMVFVNSLDIATELFEKRSGIYSDRFPFPMLNGLMGFDWNFGLMPYGERWRRHRKVFHQEFKPTSVVKYQSMQTPEHFMEHIRHFTGALIIEVTFGFNALPGDRYMALADKAMAVLAEAGVPGSFLVDIIPLLRYVPEWMIGAGFQKKAREARQMNKGLVALPFVAIKESLRKGKANPSITTTLLETLGNQPDVSENAEETIRNVAAVTYQTGGDTTAGALYAFILAMLLYPETQRKAQTELDSVIDGRLPEFSDRKNLPFINALCQEVLRWNPVVPLGIAHRVSEDDAFGNYFIPRGSTVVGNAWAMLQDERTYGPEIEKFKPEGFLDPTVHICPGRHFADNTIFITIASTLKAFQITPAIDSTGKEISVKPLFTSGFLS